MKILPPLWCAGVLMLTGLSARADDAKNLLTNSDFTPDTAQHVASWVYSSWNLKDDPGLVGKVTGTVAMDTDGHHTLTISASDSVHSSQLWWQNQDAACAGGSTYELSVNVKGTTKSGTARPTIGIYFLDAAGKWIGFQEIAGSLSPDWQKVDGKITAPENASKMGVRLGIVFTDAQADISYKQPVLQKTN